MKQARKTKGYVYLETGFLLKSFPGPGVPIIYELSFLRYPEFHIPSLTQKLNNELPDTLARASKIITLSNCIKYEIISYFKVSERMIEVLPPGINPEFKPRNRLEILPKDLPYLYSGAFAFAYPSIYEGFGLPVLEAMVSGISILSSQKTAMAEFAEGAAILVDPLSVSEITQGLKRLLLDQEYRASLIQIGLETAKNYTWKIAIERWVSVLKTIQNP